MDKLYRNIMKLAIEYISFLIVFTIISCDNHENKASKIKYENAYTIEGKIDGRDTGLVFLGVDDTTRQTPLIIFDSVKVSDSYFRFQGELESPLICKIMIKHLISGWPYTHYFVLDTGLTNIHLYKDSMSNSVITGTKLQQQFTAFNKKVFDLDVDYQKKSLLYSKKSKNTDSLDEQFYHSKYNLILNEVKANPGSFVSAYLVKRNLMEEMSVADLEGIYNSLDNKNNYYSNYLLKLINAKKQTLSGTLAPNFKIVDNKNRTLTNETFKGKYLLIDFWASWCAPCREENPYLVKAYNKFAGKGFEVISISLDQNKKKWEDAVKKDNLTWIQACDLKGSRSKIVEDFGFLTIPTNFLIDKEGRIVNKNLTGEMLEKELQKQMGKD